jgi:hypothetical protein
LSEQATKKLRLKYNLTSEEQKQQEQNESLEKRLI